MAGVGPPGREPWVVFAPTGRAVGDHVFWPFHARSELTAVAQAFVVEGLARRERVLYTGPGRPRDLRHDLAGVPDLEDCLDRGQLLVTDIATLSASDASSDPVDELIDLAAMTRDSLDAGYTGLRMVGDGTTRVVDPTRRDRFVRYEYLVDRFCRSSLYWPVRPGCHCGRRRPTRRAGMCAQADPWRAVAVRATRCRRGRRSVGRIGRRVLGGTAGGGAGADRCAATRGADGARRRRPGVRRRPGRAGVGPLRSRPWRHRLAAVAALPRATASATSGTARRTAGAVAMSTPVVAAPAGCR